jgi:hypothetical protein
LQDMLHEVSSSHFFQWLSLPLLQHTHRRRSCTLALSHTPPTHPHIRTSTPGGGRVARGQGQARTARARKTVGRSHA